MKTNEKNVIVKNVLSEEEVFRIYSILENPNNTYLMKFFTQTISDFNLPSDIESKIIAYCEKISDQENLEIAEYQFARYRNVFDEESKTTLTPNLIPHCDLTFEEPRFTFDYQVGGNTEWTIVVEEKDFSLKNNEAVTFSGTHQVHWRKPKIFTDDEYIDMIFFHLRKKGSDRYSEQEKDAVESKIKEYTELYNKELAND